jgi:hypothetical protein
MCRHNLSVSRKTPDTPDIRTLAGRWLVVRAVRLTTRVCAAFCIHKRLWFARPMTAS